MPPLPLEVRGEASLGLILKVIWGIVPSLVLIFLVTGTAVLVVLLPPSQDGVFARSTDAVVGGLCALAMAYFVPADPRRQPREDLRRLVDEFSGVLREASRALEDYDATAAWHALVRCRQTQPLIDSVTTGVVSYGNTALTPAGKNPPSVTDSRVR